MQRRDARHRVHARVEDGVRTGKDTGLGHLPSKSWAVNTGWCHAVAIAVDLLAWHKVLGLVSGPLAKAEPKTLRFRLLNVAARLHPRPTPSVAAGAPAPGPGPPPWPSPSLGSAAYRYPDPAEHPAQP